MLKKMASDKRSKSSQVTEKRKHGNKVTKKKEKFSPNKSGDLSIEKTSSASTDKL
jgi:hypothetical protein